MTTSPAEDFPGGVADTVPGGVPDDARDEIPGNAADLSPLVTDVCVVGAGPAGLAAAVAAADGGVAVTLIDAEPQVGGQFWRHPAPGTDAARVRSAEVASLHHDLRRYRRWRRRLAAHREAGRLTYLRGHEVWGAERLTALGGTAYSVPGAARPPRFAIHTVGPGGAPVGNGPSPVPAETTVHALSVVVATGAYDLQLPFDGWDLPGVMTAGGVQSLLKGHGVVAGRRVVVAGTGPFLLSVASGLARSGATVPLIAEAASPRGWVRQPRAVVAAGPKAGEALGYAADLARYRIPYRTGWTVLRAEGSPGGKKREAGEPPSPGAEHLGGERLEAGEPPSPGAEHLGGKKLEAGEPPLPGAEHLGGRRLEAGEPPSSGAQHLAAVVVAPVDQQGRPIASRAERIEADALAVGWGFVPRLEVALMLDCGTGPGAAGIPVAIADPAQRATTRGVYLAGEVCGVGGAALAEVEGELAGIAAAADLARSTAPSHLARDFVTRRRVHLTRRRSALRTFADAMAEVYPVPGHWQAGLDDSTVVCRCEEVTAGAIRRAARDDGAIDARTAKLLVRPGMGYCQGRICGYATECLTATIAGRPPAHRPTERPVAVPVPLGMLAPPAP